MEDNENWARASNPTSPTTAVDWGWEVKKRTKRIGYWVNHDDVIFLADQWKKYGIGKNIPLAVYNDICYEAARLYQLWPAGNGEQFQIRTSPSKLVTTRVEFNYRPENVKNQFGASDTQVFEALRELMVVGIVWSDSTREKPQYRVVLADFLPTKQRLAKVTI